MVSKPIRLRVFLSSPADVPEERRIAREALAVLEGSHLLRDRLSFEVVAWDDDHASAPMDAREAPQQSVNRYTGRPSDCDLTLVFLWSRIGTVLPPGFTRSDGTQFESGTVWEYEDALSANKAVWVYRRSGKPLIDLDDADYHNKRTQYESVKAFFSGFMNADGSFRAGFNTYESPQDLTTLLRQHLEAFVKEHLAAGIAAAPVRRFVNARVTADDWLGAVAASGHPYAREIDPTDSHASPESPLCIAFWLPNSQHIASSQGNEFTPVVALCTPDPMQFLAVLMKEAGEASFLKLKTTPSSMFNEDRAALCRAAGSATRHAFIACVAIPKSLLEPARHNVSLGLQTLSNLLIAPILSFHAQLAVRNIAIYVSPIGDDTPYLLNQTKRLAKFIFAKKSVNYTVDATTVSQTIECLGDVARLLAWATHCQQNKGNDRWIDSIELAMTKVGAEASRMDTSAPE